MPVKIKEVVDPTSYQPRFDFDSADASDEEAPATLKELLAELNHEKGYEELDNYTLKRLTTTLRLVSSILGIEIPRRIDYKLPISAIKTIKLLFSRSKHSDSQLIRVIDLPGSNTPATVDFFTSPPSPESEGVKADVIRILSTLSMGIEKDEIAAIDAMCDSMRLRGTFLKDTNEAVDKITFTHVHVDDDLLEASDAFLAEKTREFSRSIQPLKRESRLHVATYTYLRLLDYAHTLHFEISTQSTIPNDRGVANVKIDFSTLCKKLSAHEHRPILPDTNFMSAEEAAGFSHSYASDIAMLVSNATGFKYNKRDVLSDTNRALIALGLYLLSANLPNEQNPQPIGVVHVVAAFCSVLHQRKLKSKPEKNSRKYGSTLSAPQRLLDAYIARKSTHIPWTVQLIYMKRTKWYVYALLGRKQKDDARVAVRIAQSELARAIVMTLDHVQMRRHFTAYREFMMNAARSFVALHGKQDTVYEW